MVNFDDLNIIKKLGTGASGTSYLVKTSNNKKEYVLKIQKLLYSEKKLKDNVRDYKEQIWREIDLHEFINTLDEKEQIFFTKLYDYKIENNCNNIETNKLFQNIPYFKKLDKSKWCIKYLLDYKEGLTLKDFLIKNTLIEKQIYSILLQLCKIILIFYNGGYSHGDLHLENIIINNTNNKYFYFMDKKIPFNGYQINVIDYGFSLHKKYGRYYNRIIKMNGGNPIKYMFNEMFASTYKIINNYGLYMNDCQKAKKKLPWEHKDYKLSSLIYKIINKHSEFYKTTKDKYLKIYPYVDKFFKYFEADNFTKEIYELYNKKNYRDFLNVVNRIEDEFHLLFPEKYAKYMKWCSYYDHLLPNDVVLNLLKMNNHIDYVNYLISKCLQ
jgi:serine/threonine protein kinase